MINPDNASILNRMTRLCELLNIPLTEMVEVVRNREIEVITDKGVRAMRTGNVITVDFGRKGVN